MILSGDEFLNSQEGNNNAYCQDNEISWLNWEDLKANRTFHDYVQKLLAFRRSHPVIRRQHGECSLGFPEIQILSPSAESRVLGIMYAGRAEERDEVIILAINVYWEPQMFYLPELPGELCFHVVIDTALAEEDVMTNETAAYHPSTAADGGNMVKNNILLAPRSVQVLKMISCSPG